MMMIMNYKNSHFVHCTHKSESANVKVQNIFHGRNNITCSTNCKYSSCNTTYSRNMVCVRYIIVNILHKADNNNNNNTAICKHTKARYNQEPSSYKQFTLICAKEVKQSAQCL